MEYKIGFLDSGCGSLIFLNDVYHDIAKDLRLISQRYGVSFIFYHLGDMKNAPYADKSSREVVNLINQSIDFMCDNQVKLIVVACNTAFVDGSDFQAQKDLTTIISIIEESAKNLYIKACEESDKINNEEINLAVFATPSMIKSNLYQNLILGLHKNNKDKKSHEKKLFIHCYSGDNWVKMIENSTQKNLMKNQVISDLKTFRTKLGNTADCISAIGLFCTHYPFFYKEIKNVFNHAEILSQGKIFSKKILQMVIQDLKKIGLIKDDDLLLEDFKKNHSPKKVKKYEDFKVKSYVTVDDLRIIKRNAKIINPKLYNMIEFANVDLGKNR